jgi:hypothetical protein
MAASGERTDARFLAGFLGGPGTLSAVSTGLGTAQRRMLRLLGWRTRGLTVAQLAARLGLSERRTYAVVKTLLAHRLVVVVDDRPGYRVWLPCALEYVERRRSAA